MQKKLSKKLLFVLLAICLTLSLLVFAACNNGGGGGDDGDDGPVVREEFTSVMLKEVLANLNSSVNAGQQFGVDVLATAAIDDKTAANKDISFSLQLKGNIDVKSADTEKNSNFFLELVKTEGTEKDTVFGLGYEYIDNSPYFYINILDEKYHKVNGYSALSAYSLISGIDLSGITESLSGINLTAVLAGVLFGETGTVTDDSIYVFDFDLGELMTTVKPLVPVLTGALGIDVSVIDGLISTIFGGLTYEKDGQTVSVTNFDSLCAYVENEMSFGGNITFEFNNQKFVSAKAEFTYAENGTDKTDINFALSKMEIGAVSTPVATFASFPMTDAERRAADATNLLNFQINGQAIGYTVGGSVTYIYDVSLNMDLDPLVLLDLLKSDAPSVASVLSALGYINFTVDRVTTEGVFAENIITIHSNFEEGFIVVNFDAHDAPGNPFAIGGVYEFEALVDIVSLLINPPTAEAAATAADSSSDEGGMDIFGMLQDILAMVDLSDVYNNGVTLDITAIKAYVIEMVGMSDNTDIKNAANFIFGLAASLNIKVFDTTFGACERVNTDTIVNTMRKPTAFANKDFIKEITEIIWAQDIEQNATDLAHFVGQELEMGKYYPMKGINLKGEEVTTTGYIMYTDLDTSYAGVQNATFYIGIGNEIYQSISGMGLDDMIPLFGTLKFQCEVTVIGHENDAGVTLTATDKLHMLAGKNLYNSLIATGNSHVLMTIAGETERTYKIGAEYMTVYDRGGNDVTATVLKDGILQSAGYYTVGFNYNGYKASLNIEVDQLTAQAVDGKNIPEKLFLGDVLYLDYRVYETLADGTSKILPVTSQTFLLQDKIISATTAKKVFTIDGDTYTVKKITDYLGQKLSLSFAAETTYLGTQAALVHHTIAPPAGTPDSYKQAGNIQPNMNINGHVSFTQDGKTYNVRSDAGTGVWYAATEDGERYTGDISIRVFYGTTDIILNENGVITNLPNAYKAAGGARSTTLTFEVIVEGISHIKTDVKAYELGGLQTAPKLSAGGQLAAGAIHSLGNAEYYVNGEKVALELKYIASLDKYAIVVAGTETVVVEVDMTVTDANGNAVTLSGGAFTATGTYFIDYDIDFFGVEQQFRQKVVVGA